MGYKDSARESDNRPRSRICFDPEISARPSRRAGEALVGVIFKLDNIYKPDEIINNKNKM
jgi:hypothetical protein